MAVERTIYLKLLDDIIAFNGGVVDEEGYLRFTKDGEALSEELCAPIFIGVPGSGGGGGSTNNATLKVTNTTGWLYASVAENRPCPLKFNWSSIEDELSTGSGTLQVFVADILKNTRSIDQGDVEEDVSKWLVSGSSNTVKLIITDVYGNTRRLNFTIEVVSLSITSTFDGKSAHSGAISYYYVPTGEVDKTVYFLLDGKEIGTSVVTTSDQQQDFIIPAQSHGSHTFEVYMTAEIGGNEIESNHLYYDLICLEAGKTTPIIASSYQITKVEQYDTFVIPYRVYNPASLTSSIVLSEDGKVVKELTVDRTEQQWSHQCNEMGDNILTITCGDTVKTFTIPVIETTIKINAVTNNLVLDLDAYGRSNLEANPLTWESNGVSVEFSGFNKSSDGWQLDEDGVTVMRVGGDARLVIPMKLFEKDARATGKTIEIEFATRDVRNYTSTLISCMDKGRGLEVTSQEAAAASAQSFIGTQYKEEEHIRLSFVIEKRTGSKMMLCYLNGICSGAVAYPDDDIFTQVDPVEISIGSSECTIDIYHIRVYDNDLTRHQVLDNWIADTQIGSLKRERWARNNVYSYGKIVIDKLPKDLPYMVLEGPALPQFKDDKKTVNGYYVDPVHPERNFRFEGTQIDVQGTSSQYYYVKNYKSKYKTGFIMPDGTVAETYALNENAVPVSTFTYKADVASSEGANNVVLAKLFNDLAPTKTPAQEADPRVRQTIDGHPIVIFWDSGSGPVFMGKYNFNNDKGTHETFGFVEGDESWEIRQNGTDLVGFKNADFSGDWTQDFEARYPEDNTDISRLQQFIAWVASTNTLEATGNALTAAVTYAGVEYTHDTAEYRLAKFVNEAPQWVDVAHSIHYYLFTLLFLCIDQREKNAFPSYIAAMKVWIWLFYDADSSLGINNKGALAFSPFLEDIDYTEAGDPVFNGQANVFWNNIRLGFGDRVESMYQGWRTNDQISFEITKGLFDDHQSKWPEAIFNEDMYKKCIEAWVKEGDGQYLPMLLGKKELQRAWWLFNRFRYMDSKYVTGTSMENRIMIRAHEKADISLRAYVPIYGNVFYNSLRVQVRMLEPGTEYLFPWAASGAEDPVIGINDADLLTSLGDLSGLMVETIDIAKATHLTHLYLGSNAEGYENKNLLSLVLGNNTLLKYIDVRNCTSLAQSVNASGCTNVEEIYFDGTAIKGLSVPNGGVLKILHLPGTVTSLVVKNQPSLTEFEMPNYSNITNLNLENAGVLDTLALDILREMAPKSYVRLIGMDLTFTEESEMDEWRQLVWSMRGRDENNGELDNAVVSGKIYLNMSASLSMVYNFMLDFPNFEITCREIVNDILLDKYGRIIIDSEGNYLVPADGTHTSEHTGETIDEFIQEQEET